MTIDILSYELKYKNDDHIMELIRSYERISDSHLCLSFERDSLLENLHHCNDELFDIKLSINEYKRDIQDVIAVLKSYDEDRADIEKAIETLEDLEMEMR